MQATATRETVLFEEVEDGIRLAVFEKNYRYLVDSCGTAAQHPRQFLKTTDGGPMIDSAPDEDMQRVAREKTGLILPYIDVELWQHHEVDTREEFEFTELLMEHYILRGRGPEVYYEYAEDNNERME